MQPQPPTFPAIWGVVALIGCRDARWRPRTLAVEVCPAFTSLARAEARFARSRMLDGLEHGPSDQATFESTSPRGREAFSGGAWRSGVLVDHTLWSAAEGLPVARVLIERNAEFDQDCWFGGRAPTRREVAEHSKRIQQADLAYPVILASDGQLMDGGHRIAKAWLAGHAVVNAVRLPVDPVPDWVEVDAEP